MISELEKRYEKALVLLRRTVKAEAKLHWEEGETYEDVVLDIRHFLSDLKLEEELCGLSTKEKVSQK